MDLALALGQPAEVLARTMTEREFRRWRVYIRKRLLPQQRLEFYLAQVAQWIAVTMGGAKDAKISDFMIELQAPSTAPAEKPEEVDVAALREAFGYKPRKPRRKKE